MPKNDSQSKMNKMDFKSQGRKNSCISKISDKKNLTFQKSTSERIDSKAESA